MDLEQAKQQARTGWGLGDYSWLSEQLRPAARALCDACAVSAGQEVLDVAAGDGNFALACAEEGASVVASDLSPVMVERGAARSAAEGFDVEWLEADAEDLPFEDGRFDCVGSVFGAMIAPRPRLAAEEMFRVARPGNTVGMTAWTPESRATELFRVARQLRRARSGRAARSRSGACRTPSRERFDGSSNSIEMERRSLDVVGRLAGGADGADGAPRADAGGRQAAHAGGRLRARCSRTSWSSCEAGPAATARSRWTSSTW